MAQEGEEAKASTEESPEDVADPDEPELPREIFEMRLTNLIRKFQYAHGLRYNDHMRYRRYCTLRLRGLGNKLKFKAGKGRNYKHNPIPDNIRDRRFLEVLLFRAERAWSYGMQHKLDNAEAAQWSRTVRQKSRQRFNKAVKYAEQLHDKVLLHGDPRTVLEAEAYLSFCKGTAMAEKSEWDSALPEIQKCRDICRFMSYACKDSQKEAFVTRRDGLVPLLRECLYNLGKQYEEDEEENVLVAAKHTSGTDSQLTYRGHDLPTMSADVRDIANKVLAALAEGSSAESPEKGYVTFKPLVITMDTAVRKDMLDAGMDGHMQDWRLLVAFTRQFAILDSLHQGIYRISGFLQELSKQSRKKIPIKSEVAIRDCEQLKKSLKSMLELPGAEGRMTQAASAYSCILANCRCLFLALCHVSLEKHLEAASLLEMLSARIDDQAEVEAFEAPFDRLQEPFGKVGASLPVLAKKWHAQNLVALYTRSIEKEAPQAIAPQPSDGSKNLEETDEGKDGKDTKPIREAPSQKEPETQLNKTANSEFDLFPPKMRTMVCKPLLFDLAFPYIEVPDLETLLSEDVGAMEGDKKGGGLLGRVAGGVAGAAGGLGSRLGGLFGRK